MGLAQDTTVLPVAHLNYCDYADGHGLLCSEPYAAAQMKAESCALQLLLTGITNYWERECYW